MNEPAERFLTPLAIESESEQPIIVVPSSFLGSNFCSNIGCCLLFAAIVRCSVFNWIFFPVSTSATSTKLDTSCAPSNDGGDTPAIKDDAAAISSPSIIADSGS